MKNWEYNELVATYYNAYFSLIEQGCNTQEANNRTMDDFWFFPTEENIIQNLISISIFIKIEISFFKKLKRSTLECFTLQKKLITKDLINKELNQEEKDLLEELLEENQKRIEECTIV